jgi:hypothetical protein
MFKILAKINKISYRVSANSKWIWPKPKKWQMAIIGYRYYVTTRALR